MNQSNDIAAMKQEVENTLKIIEDDETNPFPGEPVESRDMEVRAAAPFPVPPRR